MGMGCVLFTKQDGLETTIPGLGQWLHNLTRHLTGPLLPSALPPLMRTFIPSVAHVDLRLPQFKPLVPIPGRKTEARAGRGHHLHLDSRHFSDIPDLPTLRSL